jgi:GABA(A) receptor-associated protein
MTAPFRQRFPYSERANESSRIRDKFPDRIPVIVERSKNTSAAIPHIDKEKFLVPGDLTVSQFIYIIRRRIELSSEMALFLYVGNTLPTTGTLLRELYSHHSEDDGFLYITYCGENTFGLTEAPVHTNRSHAHWSAQVLLSH